MPAQSRRAASRPTRSQRRSGVQASRTYNAPATSTIPVQPRRTFAAEPAPVDRAAEYGFIRKDLIRILLWATVLFAAMIALSFVF